MTSDINGKVVGIQGNAVVDQTLTSNQDGYVLTWSNADGYFVARPAPRSGLTKLYFTGNTTWTCPEGIYTILLIGCGGGGGGSGSQAGASNGGAAGGAALQQTSSIDVVPGVTYTITIGSGGAGSIKQNSYASDGGQTIFANGGSTLFTANGAAGAKNNIPGACLSGVYITDTNDSGIGSGGISDGGQATNGSKNSIGQYSGGTKGNTPNPGAGGGAGPQGSGGNGGNGVSSGTNNNGSNASDNTGAGGGGAGGSTNASSPGGNGGAGGSGYLYIVY